MSLNSAFSMRSWLNGGAHFMIFGVTAAVERPELWRYALLAMAAVSLAAWAGNYRRLRRIADTPSSKIASAAQGYVEIGGRCNEDAAPLSAPLSDTTCLWYQYEIHEQSGNDEWTLRDAGTSDAPFVITDATGRCEINPVGAEVMTNHEKVWSVGKERYTERLLLPQERVYALGEFVTVGGADSTLDAHADTAKKLAEWKQDQATLLKRYDLNNDGKVDLQEWELARHQARREVDAAHRLILASEGTHTLRKPHDGRLYLLSNYLPDRLHKKYTRWAWAHAIFCVGACAAAAVLFSRAPL